MRAESGRMFIIALLAALVTTVSARCDRAPEGNTYSRTTMNDGRFQIQISGNPETYVPGEQYTVFLRGTVNILEQHKFTDFLLVIEQEQQEMSVHSERSREPPPPSVGHFTLLGDALTKFSEVCPNAISQTNSLQKTDIQVFWKAPPAGSGCVAFRATVVERRDLWYMDEGDLTRVLCEEVTDSIDTQPAVLQKCCACDEAKYEVTFEGLWSRNTHPKDFPTNGWLTRFSDVIGASHTKNYTFWNYAEYASEGLRQVAENGNTRMLESELKGKSEHIRTIIKARGISYPNVTGKTFAVFRVDNQHHLMSLVSMIDPSPDWFVGVSSLELCLRNCSWIESKILNLYPCDAGTDDGITYLSDDAPSAPRNLIRRIKTNTPNNPKSPFYDQTGTEMKPFARLYLSRQRLYEKPCDPVDLDEVDEACAVSEWSHWSPCSVSCGRGIKYQTRKFLSELSAINCPPELTNSRPCWGAQRTCPEEEGGSEENSVEKSQEDCEVTEWSEWSPCSATCDRGTKYRQRKYVRDSSRYVCTKLLTSRASCWGMQRICPDHSEDRYNDPMCALTDWGEWSMCSVPCGVGSRTRNRRYLTRNATKHCTVGLRSPPLLIETEPCAGHYGSCEAEENETIQECPNRPWSDWSPCSVSCGNGYKIRTRDPVNTEVNYGDSVGSVADEDEEACDDERDKEIVACRAEIPTCDISSTSAEDICSLPKDIGPCRANMQRWFFDIVRAKCDIFSYSGCQGNRNNFKSKEYCEKVCGEFRKELITNRTVQKKQLGVSVSGVLSYNLQLQDDANIGADCVSPDPFNGYRVGDLIVNPNLNEEDTKFVTISPVIDCRTSGWSKWSPCNITGSCGKGTKQKHREILVHAMNGGRACPKKLFKVKKCRIPCEKNRERERERENKPHELSPTWGNPSLSSEKSQDCVMSKWSPWTPCSATCGPTAQRQRTRQILRHPRGEGQSCMSRIETDFCNLINCLP